jgi:hypothetical protein
MDIARRKNCATPNSIVEQFKNEFEAQWTRTTQSGEENGSLVFYEGTTNTYPLVKLSEGRHLRYGKTQYAPVVPTMPEIGPETDKAIGSFRTAGRSVYFLAYFHTHPNFTSGASRSGEPSLDADVPYQSRHGNVLGIIKTGQGYSFFSNGKTFRPGDAQANDCIWQLNNSRN